MSTDFSNVYWIGGGSGAGKSTIAQRIAALYECKIYSTDNAMGNHSSRCTPQECPNLAAFIEMSIDERWANRDPKTMLDTFHWFNGEGFDMIIDDLQNGPKDCNVLVEGFRLLPKLVKPHLHTVNHGIWLIPTPKFRQAAFENRGTLWDIPNKTSRPEKALENLLTRDALFTDRVQTEAASSNCPVIVIDGSANEDEMVSRVAEHFKLPITHHQSDRGALNDKPSQIAPRT